nr:MAG TPA: hypothetical protein [Caudoviricetes sp.]
MQKYQQFIRPSLMVVLFIQILNKKRKMMLLFL